MSISDLYNIRASTRRQRENQLLSLPVPTTSRAISSRLCNICYANRASYTCPHCNVPYCSLSCFRSQQHGPCSTRFSVATLKAELGGADEARADESERQKAMEILRRLQDPTLPDQDSDDEDDDEEEEDGEGEEGLRREVTKMDLEDLDALSPPELLALLTPSERRTFTTALSDPSKAQQLITKLERDAASTSTDPTFGTDDDDDHNKLPSPQSIAHLNPTSLAQHPRPAPQIAILSDTTPPLVGQAPASRSIWTTPPWWEQTDPGDKAPHLPPTAETSSSTPPTPNPFETFATSLRRILSPPTTTPAQPVPTPPPNLAYNLLAVLMAYTYTLRHLNLSSLSSLLPSPAPKPHPTVQPLSTPPPPPPPPQPTTKSPLPTGQTSTYDSDDLPPLEPDSPPSPPSLLQHIPPPKPLTHPHQPPPTNLTKTSETLQTATHPAASSSKTHPSDAPHSTPYDSGLSQERQQQDETHSRHHPVVALEAFHLLDQLVPFLTALTSSSRSSTTAQTNVRRAAAASSSFSSSAPARSSGSGSNSGGGTRSDYSRTILQNVPDSVLFLLARFRPEQVADHAAKLLLQLLSDADALLQAEKIISDSDLAPRYGMAAQLQPASARFAAFQHSLALNALWDLNRFFEHIASISSLLSPSPQLDPGHESDSIGTTQKARGAQHKIAYYACKTILDDQSAASAIDTLLVMGVKKEIQRLQQEIEAQEQASRVAATNRVLAGNMDGTSILPPSQ